MNFLIKIQIIINFININTKIIIIPKKTESIPYLFKS